MIGNKLHGHYRAQGVTVAGLFGANAILLSARWADTHRLCVIERVRVAALVTAAITGQRIDPLTLSVQRGYTANESAGFASFLPTGISGRSFLAHAASSLAQLAVASAVAGISGGTRNADQSPIGQVALPNLAAVGSGLADDFFCFDSRSTHPLTLSKDEGFAVSFGGTALATGALLFAFIIDWAEIGN
jgi:hypothetical protein